MIPRFRLPHTLADLLVLFTRKKADESLAEFEESFAEAAGQSYARVFPYGRTALVAVLEYLKERSLPQKTQVICPSYTCIVVAHAIVEAGLEPVFVDSEEETLNIDWAFAKQAVSGQTLAIISTSLFGNPVRKSDIESFRAQYPEVAVVQDCAHSFFAGDVHRDGIAAIYGMNVSKLITTVFGGVVSTDDDELSAWLRNYQGSKLTQASRLDRLLRSLYLLGSYVAFSKGFYWFTFWLQRNGFLQKFVAYYRDDLIDFPADAYKQIGSIELELGRRQISDYAGEIQRRRRIAARYRKQLPCNIGLELIEYGPNPSYSHFVLRSNQADDVARRMSRRGIELGRIVDYDISSLPAYASAPYFGRGVSQSLPPTVLNLPIHRGVSDRVADTVAKHLSAVVEEL